MKKLIGEKIKAFVVLATQACFLAGVTVFSVMPMGCKLEENPENLEGDHSSPVIEDVKVVDENTLEIDFSEGVKVEVGSVTETSKQEGPVSNKTDVTNEISDSDNASENSPVTEENKKPEIDYSDDGSKVTVTLPEETVPGNEYVFSGTVEDEKGNTLTFSIPFVGYNGNLPKIVMTEIQTESLGQSTTEKKNGTYRNEFIEFLALSDGNLSGFELVSAYDGEERKYVFPNVDVKAGEIFVVHLRSRGEGCISETGEDLNLAFGGYAKEGIRDLWAESDATALGNDTDVIFLRNAADGSIWDGVMFRSEKVSEWQEKFVEAANLLAQIGFYANDSVEAATITEGMTASKTLCRKNAFALQKSVLEGEEISYPLVVSAADWVVASSSCGLIPEEM